MSKAMKRELRVPYCGAFLPLMVVLSVAQQAKCDSVYFATREGFGQLNYGNIWRGHLDGTGAVKTHHRTTESGIAELEFSPQDGKVYWSAQYGGLWNANQ